MNIGLKAVLAAALGLALVQLPARAQDTPELKDKKEKLSYAIGMNIGSNLKRGNFDVNLDTLIAAIKDAQAGKPLKLTEQQAQDAFREHQMEARAKMEEERKKQAEKNQKAGAAFLEENKKKPGVKTKSVKLADNKTAELQYKVVKEGTGPTPKSTDTVSVNYRGTLIDGKEFDSSAKNNAGQPVKFPVTGVIRGWTEALQLMPVGSKWELYIPAELAYGDIPRPGIEPGSTLVFEVELVGAEAPPEAAKPAPLTSDIIKVPSAEEMKKGAKIEVLKPEDAAKQAQQGQPAKPAEKK